jgi:hypothetical protein
MALSTKVTRLPERTFVSGLSDAASLVLVIAAVPVGLLLVGAPLALLIRGVLEIFARLF